jgi:hypothetical protein
MQMASGEQGAADFYFCNSGVVANRLCAEHHGPAYVQEAGCPADLRDALELSEAVKMQVLQVQRLDPHLQTSSLSDLTVWRNFQLRKFHKLERNFN